MHNIYQQNCRFFLFFTYWTVYRNIIITQQNEVVTKYFRIERTHMRLPYGIHTIVVTLKQLMHYSVVAQGSPTSINIKYKMEALDLSVSCSNSTNTDLFTSCPLSFMHRNIVQLNLEHFITTAPLHFVKATTLRCFG